MAGKQWSPLEIQLSQAMGHEKSFSKPENKERIEAYKQITDGIPEYHQDQWYDSATKTRILGGNRRKAKDFETSDWYKFQETVKQHQREVITMLDPVFNETGIKDVGYF